MRHVGVREFRDKATMYLSGSEVLSVEKHGKPIGYYIPAPRASEEERQAALAQFDAAAQRFLEESGLTEDELADSLDLNKSFDASRR
ncbi:MAG: hypothetical protein M3176_03530 [Chloroflexota bacterium]|nr:hypothetical protein [Chloroflexota bacterium]MDQ6905879.1 hypothetical protein [Chloroflexota bacterium]